MKITIAVLIFIGSTMLIRADQLVESVQQALKDQGFYYGEINGETNANLTAAIRRYQIRNGLQVSGELNSETLQSLGINSSASARSATKPASPSPAEPAKPGERPSNDTANGSPATPIQPFGSAPQDQQLYPSNPVTPSTSPGGVLVGTPFEAAPAGVQRNVVLSAQIALARRGLYHEEVNGVFGPSMEFSLRAYQARTRLPVTGRLDLETLAALRLLPRPHEPFYDPSRRRMRPPPGPPVRGEWVPE
ncbi:MAG TPA: peptidoglycan-binding protein [Candidatus Udaeobacter sp.]|jgi:peptidoglycan hydrolase-like protein with peptidoglycan-binding domain